MGRKMANIVNILQQKFDRNLQICYNNIKKVKEAKYMATQQIGTRLPEEEKERVEEYCKKRDISVAQLIRRAIKEYMRNH